MSTRLRHLASLLALLFFVTLAVGSSDGAGNSAAPSIPREVVQNSSWDGSVRQVERYLEKTLRDPSSFEAIEWSEVVKKTDGTFMVRCKYRAKNGFGGYVISNQLFTLDARGDVTGAVDW